MDFTLQQSTSHLLQFVLARTKANVDRSRGITRYVPKGSIIVCRGRRKGSCGCGGRVIHGILPQHRIHADVSLYGDIRHTVRNLRAVVIHPGTQGAVRVNRHGMLILPRWSPSGCHQLPRTFLSTRAGVRCELDNTG